MNLLLWIAALFIMQQSPASQAPPRTVTPQSYPREIVVTGQSRFVDECSFCHGRDAAGSETGPDLTQSDLVAQDRDGDKIGPVVRNGRVEKGMPAIRLSDADLAATVAFIKTRKAGARRSVAPADLETGSADAGRDYFNGAGRCATCHSPAGDLAGVGNRLKGLELLRRMLYPTNGHGATVAVTLPGMFTRS